MTNIIADDDENRLDMASQPEKVDVISVPGAKNKRTHIQSHGIEV